MPSIHQLLSDELDRLEAIYDSGALDEPASMRPSRIGSGLIVFESGEADDRRSFLDFAAVTMAGRGITVSYLVDGDPAEAARRLLATIGAIPHAALVAGHLDEARWARVASATARLADLPLTIESLTATGLNAGSGIRSGVPGANASARPAAAVVERVDWARAEAPGELVALVTAVDPMTASSADARAAADAWLLPGSHGLGMDELDVAAVLPTGPGADGHAVVKPWPTWVRASRSADPCYDRDTPTMTATAAAADLDQVARALDETIFGQPVALRQIVDRLRVSAALRVDGDARPFASFLFAGPTGVGKTQTAKSLAAALFGDRRSVIRLDLSENSERHSLSRLIGPPPGYVGHADPDGWLTTRIAERPDSLIIWDEIEKAHPDVWNVLLQILDEGELTDGRGVTARFDRSVVVITTNLGSSHRRAAPIGFAGPTPVSRARADVMAALRTTLPAELLGRLDEVVTFDDLAAESLATITRRSIARIDALLRTNGRSVIVDDAVVDAIAQRSLRAGLGARFAVHELELAVVGPVAALGAGTYRVSMQEGQNTRITRMTS